IRSREFCQCDSDCGSGEAADPARGALMDLPDAADVLVIGGGPAGSSAATQLARAGHDVVLIDKQHHPRETVGESVLPSAWRYFDLLGVSEAVERSFVKKAGGVVAWG